MPADSPELLLKVRWLVRDLHQPVGAAVVELPADDRGCRSFHEFVGGAVCVVSEEHPALWLQAVSHQ